MAGRVYQINVKPETPGQRGLPKRPVELCFLSYMGLEGDFNYYRSETRHGDPDMALLIMPLEILKALNEEGWPVQPGDIGDNITTIGIPYSSLAPGKIFRLGQTQIQVSKRCDPCMNLCRLPYVGLERGPQFIKTMVGRRGWYARVLREGQILRGGPIEEMVEHQVEGT